MAGKEAKRARIYPNYLGRPLLYICGDQECDKDLFAERLGIAKSTLSKYLDGSPPPPALIAKNKWREVFETHYPEMRKWADEYFANMHKLFPDKMRAAFPPPQEKPNTPPPANFPTVLKYIVGLESAPLTLKNLSPISKMLGIQPYELRHIFAGNAEPSSQTLALKSWRAKLRENFKDKWDEPLEFTDTQSNKTYGDLFDFHSLKLSRTTGKIVNEWAAAAKSLFGDIRRELSSVNAYDGKAPVIIGSGKPLAIGSLINRNYHRDIHRVFVAAARHLLGIIEALPERSDNMIQLQERLMGFFPELTPAGSRKT